MPPDADAPSDTHFLSYSRADERFALRFATDLRAHGVAMWVDQLDIRPSEHWDRAIERAVRDCRGLVVILSPRSVASDNVADEISFAIDSGKTVIPVMIERCSPPLRITRMQMIDATGSYDKALQQCVAEIRRSAGGPDRGEAASRVPSVALDAEIVATAKRRLTALIGPIAGLLVDKAASRAASGAELYSLLKVHIDDETERERFAASASPPPVRDRTDEPPARSATATAASPISPEEIAKIARVLTRYIGPIAPIIAQRESRECGSLDDLRARLAGFIAKDSDRAEFIRRS